MLNKTKKFTLFFAATLNIVASALFVRGTFIRYSEVDNSHVVSALGTWFAAASVLLWVVFVVLFLVARNRK